MKINKTSIILIFLISGIHSWTFSQEKETDDERFHLIIELMDNNLGYSQDVTTSDIIQWEDELVATFRQRKDYKHMFLMQQMAVYAYAFQAQITEALKKSTGYDG